MSTGLVICSTCKREVHQDGENQTWRHCEDKSSRCAGAKSIYPSSKAEIVGKFCGGDDGPLLEENPMADRIIALFRGARRGSR